MDFPIEEYEKRITDLIRKMEKKNLDAVMLTTAENTRYFCGLQSIVWSSKVSTPGLLVVTKDKKLALIGSATAIGPMLATSCMEEKDLYYYSSKGEAGVPETYPDIIFEVLKKFGVARGKIGMELGKGFRLHMTYPVHSELMGLLNQAEIIDFSHELWELRSVKSQREIEIIREACKINDNCYKAAFESIELGKTTEWNIFQAAADEAFRQGCESMPTMGILFGKGRYELTNCPPSDKVISKEPHQILFIDGGPCYKGYYTDIIRMAVTGELTSRQKEFEKISHEALYTALESIKPGVSCAQVSENVNDVVHKAGFDDYHQTYNWTGHCLGLDIHELPDLAVNSDFILKEGMYFSVEPLIMDKEEGMFVNEQNILVTKDGYEILSKFPIDTIIL